MGQRLPWPVQVYVGRAGLKDGVGVGRGGSKHVSPLGNSLVGNKGSLFHDSFITINFFSNRQRIHSVPHCQVGLTLSTVLTAKGL